MDIFAFVIFAAKVFLIEGLIELLRQATYAVQHNAWATDLLHTHKNRYFNWFLQGFETISVIGLLWLGYSITFIVIILFILTFIVKYLGNRIFKK